MHHYQSKHLTKEIEQDFLKELLYTQDLLDDKVYLNLDIEIEARAFEALVQEFIMGEHLPISELINKTKFENKLSELRTKYLSRMEQYLESLKII